MEFTSDGILIEGVSKSEVTPLLEATEAQATVSETDIGVFVRYESEDKTQRELVKMSLEVLEKPTLTV